MAVHRPRHHHLAAASPVGGHYSIRPASYGPCTGGFEARPLQLDALVLGHPFVFAREAFGELRSLHEGKAVWKLIEAHPERVSRVEIAAPLPPDVDDPEDHDLALAHWRSIA
jgi:hypothetical protein